MSKESAEELDTIGSIYETGLDAARWNEALGMVAARVGATRVMLHDAYLSRADALLAAHNIPSMAVDLYRDRFWRTDPWNAAVRAQGAAMGNVYGGEQIVNAETLEASEFYREFMNPMDVRYTCGTVLQDQWRGLVPPTYLACYRPVARGDFGRGERAMLAGLVPHLQAAVDLFWRQERFQGLDPAEIAVLDRLAVGVVVANQHGRVLYVNPSAQAILHRNDGLAVERGRLTSASVRESWRLNRIIGSACLPGTATPQSDGAMAVTRTDSSWPYLVQVVPLARGRNAAAAVFMTDPASGASGPDAPEFRTSGLTQAERRVLDEFHTGLSRRQIAARLGLSPNTVHAHLKSIFAKTGATRQADLARLGLLRASGPASGARPAGPAPRTRSITRRRMPAHATRPKRR